MKGGLEEIAPQGPACPIVSDGEGATAVDVALRLFFEDPGELQSRADQACRRVHGQRVYVRGLIEYTNHCAMDCAYCGIRRGNREVRRYRMSAEEIVATAARAYGLGYRSFVLQGGEDPSFTDDVLARIVEGIKRECHYEVAVALSAGVRGQAGYRRLREAGIDRYLLRFETSDPRLYSRLKNGESLSRRLDALRALKELGYETGSGFMTGLPGEGLSTLADNAVLARELGCDMVGIGPFIPHPKTPLAGAGAPDLGRTLRALALTRLLLPKAHMPATTAAGSVDGQGREKMLSCGANVVMPNIGLPERKADYQLYPGKICVNEDYGQCGSCLAARVASIGKRLDYSVGGALA